jgi:hypothetical protein
MVFRRCRALIPLAASLLVAAATLAGVGVVTAGTASAAPEITICLTYSSSYCADVKDSTNKSGEPIWLYQESAGAHDYHWYEEQLPCGDGSCTCQGNACYEFVDAQNQSLCLGLAPNLESIELIGCELTEGGTGRAAWLYSGDYLVNYALGEANGGYLAANSASNGSLLYAEYYSAPGGSVWERWSGP